MRNKKCFGIPVIVAAVIFLSAGFSFAAEPQSSAADKNDNKADSWKGSLVLGVELTKESNIYNLTSKAADDLDINAPNDVASGRFKNMESVDDLIFSPSIFAIFKTPGDSDIEIRPRLTYHMFTDNSEKSHPVFDIKVKKGFSGDKFLALETEYMTNVFKKNYLADAVDQNANNNISSSEKIYKGAYYTDTLVDIIYGQNLWKTMKTDGIGPIFEKISADVLLGVEYKEYDAPFAARSEDVLKIGAGVKFDFKGNISVRGAYLREQATTPVKAEIMILDETILGVDLNGVGGIAQTKAKTMQNIDRAHNDNTFSLKVDVEFPSNWNWFVKLKHSTQTYTSKEKYDFTHKDREDTLDSFGLGVEKEIIKDLRLAVEWTKISEDADRKGVQLIDPADEKAYKNTVYAVSLLYKI
ncbi:MAG: hypothetical protein OEV59_04955 [Deltaproteobacteria bacterium]|nr:hypothetical protein [Deltaproteobacteria bacterium]